MREILFRGKGIHDGKWYFGSYGASMVGRSFINSDKDIHYDAAITFVNEEGYADFVKIDEETVGQYTGLTDKNGTKIFEGDIVEFEDTGEDGYEYSEGFDFRNRAVVVWDNGRWELDEFASDNSGVADDMRNCHDDFVSVFAYQSWVIGNIYDNPELIGGTEE